eukprot:CAMPEP_0117025666 /NCGR_PEP_ID=MMETSP0472-20121206/18939_1 /TAXON_ID=693140 ORGANISM="Tiarina fusus, Strain LIS" /NCGR_SAMPLE_ID=MMETSP0472 /ASSEMBLY_ACC=CAM_ASM_000603 /LENGTH=362 /DNA_ID=CAMNT_0004732449 /DNA_START=8 /DNA_END=1096 /DNA_ORIENTATION=+
MSILPGSNDSEKLHALCEKTYKEQAVWFLNAFWDEFAQNEAERLWGYVNKCGEIDIENHADGSGLDEMTAHVFLEKFAETLTVRELRAKLRSTGAIGETERPKKVPLTHYLLFRYNSDWHLLVNSAQGDNSVEIAKAQKMLEEVSAAFQESQRTATAASQAFLEAETSAAKSKQREEASKIAAEQSKVAEEDARAAQAELEAALAELHAQEKAYNDKKEALEKKSEEGGVVSKNKAKAELAQHLAEDPLPLRKAKITQEAAVKRADRATVSAGAAREAAEVAAKEATIAREAAEEARVASAKAKSVAEAALAEAESKLKEAEAYLEEVKAKPGCAHGALWWIERELHEQKAYLPESKGGYRK